ncbi:hypothetical protein ACFWZ4_15510 [Frateuria sp. GZRe12]|uniref:hypothetical protein n=1 Tax=Frateuria sp. GZRe12 TaxID=3351533 RepID=UPI003EDB95A3
MTLMVALVLALPVSVWATVAMEAQEATTGSTDVVHPVPAGARSHRPLFIVKYVLRRPAPETPQIVMDDPSAQIMPPGKDVSATTLGAIERDPNTLVCTSWGCQRRP